MGIPPPGNAMAKGVRELIKPRVEGFVIVIVIPTLEIFSHGAGTGSERPQGIKIT